MKQVWLLALGLVLGSCIREVLEEEPSFLVVKNTSSVPVDYIVQGTTEQNVYSLAPGDSTFQEGYCLAGLDEGCAYTREFDEVVQARLVFNQESELVFEWGPCNGERNLLAYTEIDFEGCGYREYFIDGAKSFIFEITDADYAQAEPFNFTIRPSLC